MNYSLANYEASPSPPSPSLPLPPPSPSLPPLSPSLQAVSQFTTSPKLDKLGMRGSNTSEVVFEDVKVPGQYTLSILSVYYQYTLMIVLVY